MTAGRRAWIGVGLALALGAALAVAVPGRSLDWQPGLATSAPWRAWSAAWVHLSRLHLAINLAGAALVVAFGVAARVPPRTALAWLLGWPLTHALLAVRPDLGHYGGLSGVLHAGVAAAAMHLALAGRDGRRAVGVAVLAGVAIKVVGESPWGEALRRPAGWDIAVAPLAHASGLVCGALLSAVAEAVARGRDGPSRWASAR